MNKPLIKGLVFDTTSVNTGLVNGVVARLEKFTESGLLQLVCRHHIFELCCGAAAEVVYNKKTAPDEVL